MGRLDLYLVGHLDLYQEAFMTRRELFQRFIGAPIAAAGAVITQQTQRFPKAIVYWTETFFQDGTRFIGPNPPRPMYTDAPKVIQAITTKQKPIIVFARDGRSFWKTFYRWQEVPKILREAQATRYQNPIRWIAGGPAPR